MAFEGLDGAGKRTLVNAAASALQESGARVAVVGFPRYGDTVFGGLIGDALKGRAGDLDSSVYGIALLFAADRRDSKPFLLELLEQNDLVLADRYVSSNAAYGMARLAQQGTEAQDHFLDWITSIEMGSFALPVPYRQVYLDTPVALAQERILARAQSKRRRREIDRYEADARLQADSAAAYVVLRERSHVSPWSVVQPLDAKGEARSAADIAAEVRAVLTQP